MRKIKGICNRNSIFCKLTNNTRRLLESKKKKKTISSRELQTLKKYNTLKKGIKICRSQVYTPGYVSLSDIPRNTMSLIRSSLGLTKKN